MTSKNQSPQIGSAGTTSVEAVSATSRLSVGVVVIGRNEGERLKRCLRSLIGQVGEMVYVDSGSTDGSGEFARSLGVAVIDLDMNQPFTMARGRNAGWQYLAADEAPVEFVQFVDGDCEVVRGWIEAAYATLQARSDVVAVYGRRRERFPDASIYNTLTDLEWDHPIGESKACGGDALFRLAEIVKVSGYNEDMIAGEEAEMCLRIRRNDWIILRIDAEMTRHDAALTRFSQWWKRTVRGGHAFAEGAAMHGRTPERHNRKSLRSALIYGLFIPLLMVGSGCAALLFSPFMWIGVLLFFGTYPFLIFRVFQHRKLNNNTPRQALLYAVFCFFGKFAETLGAIKYWINHARGKRTKLLEYK